MHNSSTGLSENLAATLCYALGWLTGLVFLLVEKQSNYVRFHAMQSLMTFGLLWIAGFVIGFLPGIGAFLSSLIGVLTLVLWLVLMFKAWTGERYKLPVIGEEAERQAGRMSL